MESTAVTQRAIPSPDHFFDYEPLANNPWTRLDEEDAYRDPFDDSNSDAFSFCEEDLIPTDASSWSSSTFQAPTSFDHYSARDGDKMYSTIHADSFEPKITIDRAIFVSEPAPPPRAPTPEDRRSNRLSRTFSGFGMRSKSRKRSSTAIGHPKVVSQEEKIVAADIPKTRSRSITRRFGGSGERSIQTPVMTNEPSTLAKLLRRNTVEPNKRPSWVNSWRTSAPILDPDTVKRRSTLSFPSTDRSRVSPARNIGTTHHVSVKQEYRHVGRPSSPMDIEANSPAERSARTRSKDRTQSLKVDSVWALARGRAPANSPNAEKPNRVAPTSDRRPPMTTPLEQHAPLSPTLPAAQEGLAVQSPPARSKSLRRLSMKASRPSDLLWPKFRAIEQDYQKFLTKPVGSRAASIEANLVPFLKSHADDDSADLLHHEYLKRRYLILSRWWNELMDVIDDWDNEEASFRERSMALDAAIGIMQRPEWRCIPEFAPIGRAPMDITSGPDLYTSNSIYSNMHTAFVESILRLVTLIVRRLSSKETTGMMTRAGGLCLAYAFFFCPGVVDNLIRLWNIPSNVIRKIRESVKAETPDDLSTTAATIAAHFPESIRHLQYKSSSTTVTYLSKRSTILPHEGRVDWQNEVWLDRWCGRKSDLFFTFIKQFHVLVDQFAPDGVSDIGMLCCPGVLLVQAQMSVVLRSALIKRQDTAQVLPPAGSPSTNFDTLLNADSVVPNLSASPREAVRTLTGRRFVMLIKEMLSVTSSSQTRASSLFAHSCRNMLKATARQISLFDNEACFNLCDFVEQSLTTLTGFDKSDHSFSDDATFWADVFKHMLRSNNTLTAVRVFALLHTIWPAITQDVHWKHSLCYRLLLDESIFQQHFQHWCPIVRVYYMRLLAWRVTRLEAWHNDGDLRIIKTLFFRVQESWSHFQWVLLEASEGRVSMPSTAPSNPIPGRRMLIVRLDTPPSTARPSTAAATASGLSRSLSRHLSRKGRGDSTAQARPRRPSNTEDGVDQSKRRSALFRNFSRPKSDDDSAVILPSALDGADDSTSPNSSGVIDKPAASALNTAGNRASMYEARPSGSLRNSAPTDYAKQDFNRQTTSSSASFTFSLELVERRLIPDMELAPPRLPLAAQMVLQSQPNYVADVPASKPAGSAAESARYAGRALAEWSLAVNECQNFFERRRKEGVPSNDLVETPALGVESFRRPG